MVATVWQYCILKLIPNDLFSRYGGGWVIVTGASDGIGLTMVKVLAIEHGFKVMMVARN